MKLIGRRHEVEVLTGSAARLYLEEHQPGALAWATCVAKCKCGWHRATIHGELAELDGQEHLGRRRSRATAA